MFRWLGHTAGISLLLLPAWGCRAPASTQPPTDTGPRPVATDGAPEAATPIAGAPQPELDTRRPRPPELPRPTLARAEIRAVVRSHIEEVRRCYHSGLVQDRTLAGRVVLDFMIEPGGAVADAVVAESELPPSAEAVQECIRIAATKWTFPAPPNGGKVGVTYPFELRPAGPDVQHGVWFGFDAEESDAQESGVVAVIVQDEFGRPVRGATVMLTIDAADGPAHLEATTAATGAAMFSDLPYATAVSASVVDGDVESGQVTLASRPMGVLLVVSKPWLNAWAAPKRERRKGRKIQRS